MSEVTRDQVVDYIKGMSLLELACSSALTMTGPAARSTSPTHKP